VADADLRDLSELHETTAARLRADQQRYTPRRRAVVDILAEAGQPLALPEILSRGDALAQSSVYRNLVVLEQAGVVRRVTSTDDFARYELAEDLTEHHHHLICSSCGTVDDFTASSRFEQTVARAVAEIARDTGFDAHHHRIDLIGVCNRCA
jgi:Fe2+ or Zn2+ uptake regulation protein